MTHSLRSPVSAPATHPFPDLRPLVARATAAGLAATAALLSAAVAFAGIDARLLRYPDVSADSIAFAHAGDVWVAPRDGGLAQRLSTPAGDEGLPRFSPDGRHVAFSGNYDGNIDAYVMPVGGGAPLRLTTWPGNDRVLGWTPDGEAVLVASTMGTPTPRYTHIFRVPAKGGSPEKLPVPYGSFADLADDGRTLAYVPISTDFSTWKRYRGGLAGDVWTFDLKTLRSKNVTDHPASDSLPMWSGDDLYFVSDRGAAQRLNIWHVDPDTRRTRQVTFFTDYDVRFPSAGDGAIVFENGGALWLLDLATERLREVEIDVVTDRASLRPERKDLGGSIASGTISPGGERAALEARGEVFSLPREHGVVRNLTGTSGVAERHPAWSPDGRHVAVFSDASGEYELTLLPVDGDGEPRKVTSLGPGYRYLPQWSPDSEKIAFVDQSMRLHLVEVESGRVEELDQGRFMMHGTLSGFRFAWSPDSRFVAWARGVDTTHRAIFVHDTKTDRTHQVTSGFYDDVRPAFDPEGRYLYYLSDREFSPAYSDVDNTWIYPNSTVVMAVPLRDDVPSPLAPRNDEVEPEKDDDDGEAGEKDEKKGKKAKKDEKDDEDDEGVEIDFDGFENRAVQLPLPAGNNVRVLGLASHVVVHRAPRTGVASGPGAPSPLVGWNLESREEETLVDDADSFELSANGEKLLVAKDGKVFIVDAKPKQSLEKPLATGRMEATVDPRAEWRQIFADAWRFERDFFYDPNMHGVDWDLMRERYGRLVDEATTRSDVNWIVGELIGELASSHAYRWGGDTEEGESVDVGFLGADLVLERDALRIDRILRGADWDVTDRSPLDRPGLDVEEGDYILAINGAPVAGHADVFTPFVGLAGETVELAIADRPRADGDDVRRVLVEALRSEDRLRYLAWVEENRARVEKLSDGRVGYVHVPDTGVGGQNELVRQFQGQFTKAGLIIDERFNGGGQIPDRFVELLDRPVLNYWAVRDGRDWRWPYFSHVGPKAMLINEWAGSGGDAFPFYFREAGLGPLIGTRTWGGLIGISGAPQLVDGGTVTVPTFAVYSRDGEWIIENEGVHPDIEVVADPTALAKGRDPQLEKAVEVVLEELRRNPPTQPARPPYPVR